MESTKRREVELSKLKKEAEEAAINREAAIAQLRKKHNEANAELEQQIEASNHARQRWDLTENFATDFYSREPLFTTVSGFNYKIITRNFLFSSNLSNQFVTPINLTRKHNEANAELEQQIEASNHARQRWERLRDYSYNLCATKDSKF